MGLLSFIHFAWGKVREAKPSGSGVYLAASISGVIKSSITMPSFATELQDPRRQINSLTSLQIKLAHLGH